jgi:hypothetical protein
MGLEEILTKKAKEKNIIKEGVNPEQNESEYQRYEKLLGSINELDAKIETVSSTLNNLNSIHNQTKDSVINAITEEQELSRATQKINQLFENEEFREIFEAEGIKSPEDLIKSEEYSEQEEIGEIKELNKSSKEKRGEAKQQIGTRRKAKIEARNLISSETTSDNKNLTYNNIIMSLNELLKELQNRRKTLYRETPEGHEEFKKEILDRIKVRHEIISKNKKLLTKEDLEYVGTVTPEDLVDASDYGVDEIKNGIKTYYKDQIDSQLTNEAKGEGWPQQKEAITAIENLPNEWQSILTRIRNLESVKSKIALVLADFLEKNPNSPITKTAVREFGLAGDNNTLKIALSLIKNYSEKKLESISLETAQAKLNSL